MHADFVRNNTKLNSQCVCDTERFKMKAPSILMNDDKSCFRTQCTYHVQTQTCITLAFLVIYIQYHSFNPAHTQDHVCAELPNILYYQNVPIHT